MVSISPDWGTRISQVRELNIGFPLKHCQESKDKGIREAPSSFGSLLSSPVTSTIFLLPALALLSVSSSKGSGRALSCWLALRTLGPVHTPIRAPKSTLHGIVFVPFIALIGFLSFLALKLPFPY
jgi:hypothetical protein